MAKHLYLIAILAVNIVIGIDCYEVHHFRHPYHSENEIFDSFGRPSSHGFSIRSSNRHNNNGAVVQVVETYQKNNEKPIKFEETIQYNGPNNQNPTKLTNKELNDMLNTILRKNLITFQENMPNNNGKSTKENFKTTLIENSSSKSHKPILRNIDYNPIYQLDDLTKLNPQNSELGSHSLKNWNIFPNIKSTKTNFPSNNLNNENEIDKLLFNNEDLGENGRETRSAAFKQTKKFVNAALDNHNGYRKKHKAQNLKYNTDLAKLAQDWANRLIGPISTGGKLKHRPKNKYGENIWMGYGYKMTDEEAVKASVQAWYNEISFYKKFFGKEPDMSSFTKWGHFTQVVWKKTSKVGVGIARKDKYIVVVANYDPPGNYAGEYAKNVFKA